MVCGLERDEVEERSSLEAVIGREWKRRWRWSPLASGAGEDRWCANGGRW